MDVKFVEMPMRKLAGYGIVSKNADGANNIEIPNFWLAYLSDGRMEALHSLPNIKSHDELGACIMIPGSTDGSFRYVIGIEVDSFDNLPEYSIF